jgi:hypothetical protein
LRLEEARNLYNAFLLESLQRPGLMRRSKVFQAARKLPEGKPRDEAF